MQKVIPKSKYSSLVKILFGILAALGFVGVIFVVWIILFADGLISRTSKQEAIEHYRSNESKFYSIIRYINSVDPGHKLKEFQFNINESDSIFTIEINGKETGGKFNDFKTWTPSDSLRGNALD